MASGGIFMVGWGLGSLFLLIRVISEQEGISVGLVSEGMLDRGWGDDDDRAIREWG